MLKSAMPVPSRVLVPEVLPAVMPQLPAVPDFLPAAPAAPVLPSPGPRRSACGGKAGAGRGAGRAAARRAAQGSRKDGPAR